MNAFNRVLFSVIGAALVAAGAIGLASGSGLLDTNLVDDVRDEVFGVDWSLSEVRVGALLAGIVIALISLTLVVREVLPPRRADPMVEVSVSDRGRTRVSTTALRRVYERAAGGVDGVAGARVSDLAISPDGVRVDFDARLDGGSSAAEAGAEILERGAEAVERTFPGREGRVQAVIELAHGRRARKRVRRAQ